MRPGRDRRGHPARLSRRDGPAARRDGALQIGTALGDAERRAAGRQPGDRRRAYAGRQPLRAGRRTRLRLRGRRATSRDRELVIDPSLAYSTFLGGGEPRVRQRDRRSTPPGNAYVTGFTQSPNFPTTTGAFDRTGSASNNLDAFVTKLNPAGTALVYSTFIGGRNSDWGRGIAVDTAGNAYVTGQTMSSNFPTTSGAFDRTLQRRQLPALRDRPARRVRRQAQPRRLRPRLLHVPRRHESDDTLRHRARRRAQRLRHGRDRPATSRPPPARSTRPPAAGPTRS